MDNKDDKKGQQNGLTRRRFIEKGAVGAAAVAASTGMPRLVKKAHAAKRDYILIGRPNPSTGPVAAFGETSPWMEDRCLAEINKDGGIYIEKAGKKLPVKVKLADTQSDPTMAAEVAARLITRNKVDMMLALHTPATVNPVAVACDRRGVPCITLDAPLENWQEGAPYKWAFHAFFSIKEDLVPLLFGMFPQVPNNKAVGLIMCNDPDGVACAKLFGEALSQQGYKVIDPGRFPNGHQDFSSLIGSFRKEQVEIITGNLVPPDWITCWRQCHQFNFIPKIALITRAILFPSVAEATGGDLAQNLSCEVWWTPYHPFKSSLTDETPRQLCDAWIKDTSKQWTPPLGYKYAGFELVADVLKRAKSLDKKTIRQAIIDTDLNTMVGPIKFNKENYCRTPLVGGQWVKGTRFPWDLKIVYNEQHPEIPLTGHMEPIGS